MSYLKLSLVYLIARLHLALALITVFSCSVINGQTVPPSTESSASQNVQPMSVAVILDMSSSSANEQLNARYKMLFESLLQFVEENKQHEYFIIPFATNHKTLTDGNTDHAEVLNVVKKLSQTKREGGTSLLDACYMGVYQVAAQGKHNRRVALLFSDGADNLSEYTVGEVKKLLTNTKVQLHAINLGETKKSGKALADRGAKLLQDLASVSGGLALTTPQPEDVKTAFAEIKLKLIP